VSATRQRYFEHVLRVPFDWYRYGTVVQNIIYKKWVYRSRLWCIMEDYANLGQISNQREDLVLKSDHARVKHHLY
jgi:hypothetical protein